MTFDSHLEQLEIFDLSPQVGITADRVMIGKGDDVDPALFGFAKDVEVGDAGLLIIGRCRRMEMEVHPEPLWKSGSVNLRASAVASLGMRQRPGWLVAGVEYRHFLIR